MGLDNLKRDDEQFVIGALQAAAYEAKYGDCIFDRPNHLYLCRALRDKVDFRCRRVKEHTVLQLCGLIPNRDDWSKFYPATPLSIELQGLGLTL
ncbi:hypothetical protein [Loktanella sp. Alg231-35]|uniref:hypothetical protein n=1 Tax=Loktanella sp. Alg231-35 TaxID=1922220 RepID=UPI00131F0EB8|nr:hypothetical protein [Loktanella sp. Alg231-35]